MSKSDVKNEDAVPEAYPYYWSAKNSNLSIEEFVKKYKPSMVQDDGTKPWLWVQNSNSVPEMGNSTKAVDEAKQLLNEATERVKEINDDDSIPVRASKKTGAKSKKQHKEEVQAEYTEKLKSVHKKHNYKSGKWLIFVAPDKVDTVWSRLATSVTSGPLSETEVYLAKVATTPLNESPAQRLICIYLPDVFDKENIMTVMRILLRNHGLNLSGVKSNLYTEIGLDSKHASHIQSTVWKNTDLLKDSEIKELKEAFFAELNLELGKTGDAASASNVAAAAVTNTAKKLPIKPKPLEDDPFGSSDDDAEVKAPVKKAKPTPKRKAKHMDETEDDEKPKKRR